MAVEKLGAGAIALSGPATLYEAAALRKRLLALFSDADDLTIDLAASGPWDLAGLQLLISAVASGEKAGHAVRLRNVPRVCAEIADRSGLSDWLKGATDSFQ